MVYFLDAKGVMPFIDGFELDLHKCGYELQCLLILLTLHGTMHLKVTVRIKFQRKVFCGHEIDFNDIFIYPFYNYYFG